MVIGKVTLHLSVAAALAGLAATGALGQKVDADSAAEACVAPAERNLPIDSLSDARRREVIACSVGHAVEQLRPQLPMQVDEVTTLESVDAVETTVTYRSRVDVDVRDVTPEMRANLRQSTRNNVCAAEDMRQTIGNGGAYVYLWVDRVGAFIDRTDIKAC